MHSPLPDSSALEAGIIEDDVAPSLSRAQENVRNLLRNPRFDLGSATPPHVSSPEPVHTNHVFPNSLPEPATHRASRHHSRPFPGTVEAEHPAHSAVSSRPATESEELYHASPPTSHYRNTVQQMAHQSALFNSRAIAALNHPDLSDPSLTPSVRRANEHRQRNAWKRPAHVHRRSHRSPTRSSQCFLCMLTALMLAATVATYVVLATTTHDATPTFHVLFILAIILAAVIFAHSTSRLLLSNHASRSKRKIAVPPRLRHKHRHHPHGPRRDQRVRISPRPFDSSRAFVSAVPTRVRVSSNQVRPDSRDARPTATVQITEPATTWDNAIDSVPNPPPAYGRWRGSVRADPELLLWHVVPSPVHSIAERLPSPAYDEVVMEGNSQPPSYATKDSPSKGGCAEGGRAEGEVRYQSPTAVLEPEMFQVPQGRGVGIAV